MNTSNQFFDDFADKFDSFYDGRRSMFMQWIDRKFRSDMYERYAMTFNYLGDLSGKHILDIGCGSGPYLVEALKRGAAHATGVDTAPRMLELAKLRSIQADVLERVTLIEGSFPQTCPEGFFDYAIVMGVMDYIANPVDFLISIKSKIDIGVALSFPSTHWFRTPFRKIRYRIRRCPVYFYTSANVEELLKITGFKIFEITKIPGAGMDYVVWVEM